MSSGIVHAKACAALSAGFLLYGIFTKDVSCLEYSAGALIGILISPDNDVDGYVIGDSIIKNRLGTLPHRVWRAIWQPYRNSIKHGSSLSHFPVLSTLGRVAYLFWFCVIIPNIVLTAFGFDFWYEITWWFGKLCRYWDVILALAGSDAIHWALDIATRGDKFDINSLVRGQLRAGGTK